MEEIGCNTNGVVGDSRPIHILLVDADEGFAHALIRDSRRYNISVTVTRTLAEARNFLRRGSPSLDVVVLELGLPDGRGESLLRDIEACPRQPVLVVISASLDEPLPEVFEYRPAFVGKSMDTAALLKVVRTVVSGYAELSIRRFATRFRLTQRETEVIAFIAHGAKPKEIAFRLRCSEQAVYAYLTRACRRTHCLDYHHLVGKLFEFVCQSLGRTPPEYPAFTDDTQPLSRRPARPEISPTFIEPLRKSEAVEEESGAAVARPMEAEKGEAGPVRVPVVG